MTGDCPAIIFGLHEYNTITCCASQNGIHVLTLARAKCDQLVDVSCVEDALRWSTVHCVLLRYALPSVVV